MTDPTTHSFFADGPIRSVTLPQWVDWASDQTDTDYAVVLPMIQRGSVWAPHKLMDLWDTLLRDMPIGAFLASEQTGQTVILPGQSVTRNAKASDIGLIDGQQRTLAMVVGMKPLENALRSVALWVDVAQEPQSEYRFRLWATTQAQPFGYAKASAGGQRVGKLERHTLRQANWLYRRAEKDEGRQEDDRRLFATSLWATRGFMPWGATLALRLPDVMACKDEAALSALVKTQALAREAWLQGKQGEITQRLASPATEEEAKNAALWASIQDHLAKQLSAIQSVSEEAISGRVKNLAAARDKVRACQFPVIQVREVHFANAMGDATPKEQQDQQDPPLAILFKRVGTSGEALSDADYVYAVIKHLEPAVHGMVDALLKDPAIQAIYKPTTLVMSAVRLCVLQMSKDLAAASAPAAATAAASADANKINGLGDTASMDKATFARLVREHPGFVLRFKAYIQDGGEFSSSLKQVLGAMAYKPKPAEPSVSSGFTQGLPRHALCLVPIALLETILAWHLLQKPTAAVVEKSNLAMVRFVLQGHLCILEAPRASVVMMKALKEGVPASGAEFPDQALLKPLTLSDNGQPPLAHALPSPHTLQGVDGLITSPPDTTGLRGWKRFDAKVDAKDEAKKRDAELYKRWWTSRKGGGHVHPLLLWLQRDYVFHTFEKIPALAGMDEETPYDYDHLLPSAHWAYWSGKVKDELIKFQQDGKDTYWFTGNSIGNIHVLDSSDNRSWSDAALAKKLADQSFAENGLVLGSPDLWLMASPISETPRVWTSERALAFQQAVEQRAFALYKKFYEDLQCNGSTRNSVQIGSVDHPNFQALDD